MIQLQKFQMWIKLLQIHFVSNPLRFKGTVCKTGIHLPCSIWRASSLLFLMIIKNLKFSTTLILSKFQWKESWNKMKNKFIWIQNKIKFRTNRLLFPSLLKMSEKTWAIYFLIFLRPELKLTPRWVWKSKVLTQKPKML